MNRQDYNNNNNYDDNRRTTTSNFYSRNRNYDASSQSNYEQNSYNVENQKIRMNLRYIENAGYDHLYGLSSIVNALHANVRFHNNQNDQSNRQTTTADNNNDIDDDNWYDSDENEDDNSSNRNQNNNDNIADMEGEQNTNADAQGNIKPEAQVGTFLFVQDTYSNSGNNNMSRRSNDKQLMAQQVVTMAEQYRIPVVYVDKGVLNTMSSNRPHQGYVLRCPKLTVDDHMISLTRAPTDPYDPHYRSFWLVLDEVVDPQNFGAILRSAYFLGAGRDTNPNENDASIPTHPSMGILICSKNSAPPSAVVSATSAGALELLMMPSASFSSFSSSSQIYSTNHLIRLLANAEQDGCRIIGASSSVPHDNIVPLYNLQDIPPLEVSSTVSTQPPKVTMLVLGSEGHGLRALVAKSCTEYVRIPPAFSTKSTETTKSTEAASVLSDPEDDDSIRNNVDSLNVSVTAGILLWHLLQPKQATSSLTSITRNTATEE
jgi:21S rRNA (GM2251-2'-O)-methyltransferase